MKKISLVIMGAGFILAPFFSAQAITVVESSSTQQLAQEAIIKSNNAVNAELFNRLQSLQEEVMRTRGLLEEQQQQLQELKQQRLEDYKNLDKRITEIDQRSSSQPNNNSSDKTSTASSAVTPNEVQPSVAISENELEKSPEEKSAPVESVAKAMDTANQQDSLDYQKSYELIKQRKFEQARDSFNKFISKYPDSEFQPNAHYWLGELYIIDGNFVKAKSSFQTILKKYPEHTKHPEALYKIATVNYELGDRTTAKLQMEQLINQYGNKQVNAVAKAREFLKANFP